MKVTTLAELPIGAKLILECKKDWREAIVSKRVDEKITLIVSTAKGHTYRVRRLPEEEIFFDGYFPILTKTDATDWRGNFLKCDFRW